VLSVWKDLISGIVKKMFELIPEIIYYVFLGVIVLIGVMIKIFT